MRSTQVLENYLNLPHRGGRRHAPSPFPFCHLCHASWLPPRQKGKRDTRMKANPLLSLGCGKEDYSCVTNTIAATLLPQLGYTTREKSVCQRLAINTKSFCNGHQMPHHPSLLRVMHLCIPPFYTHTHTHTHTHSHSHLFLLLLPPPPHPHTHTHLYLLEVDGFFDDLVILR